MAVVDTSPLEGGEGAWARLPPLPDARCSTLTPASVRSLQAAGAWEAVERSGRATAFQDMRVVDGQGGCGVHYSAREAGLAALGHVAENQVLCCALGSVLRSDAGAAGGLALHAPDTLQELRFSSPLGQQQHAGAGPDWAAARLERAGWVRARLVVAADGARSPTRALAGVRTLGWRYPQSAVVGVVATEPHSTAWQRFMPLGPLALLPMQGGVSSVVWSTSSDEAQRLAALPDAMWAEEVDTALRGGGEQAVAGRGALGALESLLPASARAQPSWPAPPRCHAAPGRRAFFPLALSLSGVYSAPRLALVGDAAHAVHPLAGQGLNLGISDAQLLAQTLAQAVAEGRDLGEAALLAQYGAQAARANTPMIAALDGACTRHSVFCARILRSRSRGASSSPAAPVCLTVAHSRCAAQRGAGRSRRSARRAKGHRAVRHGRGSDRKHSSVKNSSSLRQAS